MLKRKFLNHWPYIKKILLVLFFVLLVFLGNKFYKLLSGQKLIPQIFWQLMVNKPDALKKNDARTNILLLGIGGKNHDGADLTDTIILLSVSLAQNDLVLISIPRDIWISGFNDKINAAYQIGEAKKVGGGFILAKSAVEEVVGMPVHYAALIDFSGFKEIIDLINGIDLNIDETFTDNQFPLAGKENDNCGGDPEYSCRYESVTFTKGIEHMDGERALKYVRSRYATGENGTDFSRGERQLDVISAIKNKLVTQKILFKPKKLLQFLQIADKTTKTDLVSGETLLLARKIFSDKQTIRSFDLPWNRPELNQPGLLISPSPWLYEGLWVLVPKSGNYNKTHEYLKCLIVQNTNCEAIYQ